MNDPLISIVTPSYNQAEFIRDTLDSVKNQNYNNIEHFVIDGGSDDGTVEILEEYEDKYNLTWISESDQGQSDAINKGFERANGDIVAWINSDDAYFDTDVFSRVVDYFSKYDSDVIYGDLVHLQPDSTIELVDVHPSFDPTKLPYRILIGQPATFFRSEVVKTEQLRTDLHFCMDYEYWLRLSQKYSFRHVNDVLAGFRVYDEQKSQDSEAMRSELKDVLSQYSYPDSSIVSILLENGLVEMTRWIRAFELTYKYHNNQPNLAFDGSFAPISTMIMNIPPSRYDLIKTIKRIQSEGQTG
jgi:glycosyltransferase involved in cell wall biosynthesis